MSFGNKVVLITGASSGIGAAAAVLFTKEGANVVVVGRNQEINTKNGKKPLVINADLSKDVAANRIIKETISAFGKFDVLVNNAGFGRVGRILGGGILEFYDEIMATNARAVIKLTALTTPFLDQIFLKYVKSKIKSK